MKRTENKLYLLLDLGEPLVHVWMPEGSAPREVRHRALELVGQRPEAYMDNVHESMEALRRRVMEAEVWQWAV